MIVKVNYSGVGEILKGPECAALAHDAAVRVQSALPTTVDGETVLSEVTDYTTDRAASAVNVLHYQALAWQAKYGIITSAAGSAGLEVSGG